MVGVVEVLLVNVSCVCLLQRTRDSVLGRVSGGEGRDEGLRVVLARRVRISRLVSKVHLL